MCWPRIEGGLEIEERYPRTNDPREPRQKRLNFVRRPSSSRRSSDDYALMHSSFHQTRPIRAEMHERQMRQLHGQNQQLYGHNQHLQQRLAMEEEQRRRHAIEQAHHHGGHPPPPPHPPAPGMIANPHEQPRIMHHPHEGYPEGIEPVEEFHGHRVVEAHPRPRSRMPNNLHHGRSPSRGRSQRGHHAGGSIYSEDRHSQEFGRWRRGRSPTVYGSSHDSFDDLLHNPHIHRVNHRRRG